MAITSKNISDDRIILCVGNWLEINKLGQAIEEVAVTEIEE